MTANLTVEKEWERGFQISRKLCQELGPYWEGRVEAPRWVAKIHRALLSAVFPTVFRSDFPNLPENEQRGRKAGHLYAWAAHFKGNGHSVLGLDKELLSSNWARKKFRDVCGFTPGKKGLMSFLDDLCIGTLNEVPRELIKAANKPRKEAADFFRGFSYALGHTLDGKGAPQKTLDLLLVYSLLLIYPEELANSKSIEEFRRFLRFKTEKKDILGDVKRFEKVFERLGLTKAERRAGLKRKIPTSG